MYEINEIEPLVFQIQESKSKYAVNLKKRSFKFAVDVLLLLRTVPNSKENDVIKYQLSKAGTSVGANFGRPTDHEAKRILKAELEFVKARQVKHSIG